MRRTTKTTPPPTIPRLGPPGGGAPGPRVRKPRRLAIFCCSFLRISSRSGGPSLLFLPHWGSFGMREKHHFSGGASERSLARHVGKCVAKRVDAGASHRTDLDIKNLTIRVAHDFGLRAGHAIDLVVDDRLRHLGR